MKWSGIRAFTNLLVTRTLVLAFTIVMLALVAASPIALRWITRIPGIDWASLSNVGQTYGGISALLTALALDGVVMSLLYQARDVKTAKEQASRAVHQELLKKEMEDPFYMEILGIPWGLGMGLTDYDSLRRNHFIHLWVSYWEGLRIIQPRVPDLRQISS